MQKSKIEWTDYTINPVKGLCPMACSYCYARRMYKRFHWDETVRFEPEQAFVDAFNALAGSKIFVGSTMELFGDWVKPNWLEQVMGWPKALPNKTFIFLTKQPQNLIKWSPFPDNCRVGVSATNSEHAVRAMTELDFIKARVKFLSLEPLLDNDGYTPWKYISFKKINWLIIGQQTPVKLSTMPKLEWIKEIVDAADKAQIPVFLKNNLNCCAISDYPELLDAHGNLRQEFPSVSPLSSFE